MSTKKKEIINPNTNRGVETPKKVTTQEKLGNLQKQQAQVKEMFLKLQGAIELLEGILKEENGG